MTKTALNEVHKDPESDYSPSSPAAARVVDAIFARGMEATADVQMRLLAAGVAGTRIPSQTISLSESLCADPLLNRVQWELYLPAHRHEFITRKLSEIRAFPISSAVQVDRGVSEGLSAELATDRTWCHREALDARGPRPVVATSAGSKTPERLPHDSTPGPGAPEVPSSLVVPLRGFVMKVCRDFSQLASGSWTWVTCGAAFYMCLASFCTRKQIHWRAPAGGRLVLAAVTVSVLLSTVSAGKTRPFRDATANMWAEGKPTGERVSAMAAGQDGSLYVLEDTENTNNVVESKMWKLDLDTKEWNIIDPRGSVRPSVDKGSMTVVGSDLYVFGGKTQLSNTLFRFSTTEQKWEQLGETQVSGSPPRARIGHGMVAVGNDLYVFGGNTEGGTVINPTGTNTYAYSDSNELFRFSTLTLRWDQLYAEQGSGPPPSARGGHGMVVVVRDFSFYVFGGMTSWKGVCPQGSTSSVGYCSDVEVEIGFLNDLFRFSTKEEKWEKLVVSGSPPSSRSLVSMVNTVGSDLYMYGGYDGGTGSGTIYNELFRFSTKEQKWEQLNFSGTPPNVGSGVNLQNNMHMVAMDRDFFMFGKHFISVENSVAPDVSIGLFRFSTTNKQWTQLDSQQVSGFPPCKTSPCWMVPMSAVGSDLYVLEDDSNKLFRFSTTEQQWKKLNVSGTPPSTGYMKAMTVVDTYIYVFGGSLGSRNDYPVTYSNDLFWFSTTEEKWEQLQVSAPLVYDPPEMVSVGSDLYVFGGHKSDNDLTFLLRFSTKDKQGIKLDAVSGTPPRARTNHGMVAVDRDFYVFGGHTPSTATGGNEIFNDLFRFSTKDNHWMELKVSGSPPRRTSFGMATVGRDFYVFGGNTYTDGDPGGGTMSNDFFRFSTTDQKWEEIQVSGTRPSGRQGHRMVAVGNNLYSFGGIIISGESDLLVYTTQQVFVWPASGFSPMWFTRVYDGDIVQVTGFSDWPSGMTVELCSSANMPCTLTISGNASASSTIRRRTNSRIVCEAASGCTGVTIRNVAVVCTGEASADGPLQLSGAGAVATIDGVTFSDCVSVEDGGSIRAYNGATVKVSGTTFQRSSSQGNGGALALLGVHVNTYVSTSTFVDCTSALSGGAVSVSHHVVSYPSTPVLSTMKVDKCTFAGNAATKGGALAVTTGSSVTIESSEFKDNTASQEGGALDVTESSVTIKNTEFIGNTASGLGGGALHVGSSKRLDLAGNTFTGNTAPNGGGGAALWGNGTVVASLTVIGPTTLDSHVKEICGSKPNSNAAGYGPCVATSFHRLDITGLTTASSERFAGVPFPLQVRKRDTYGQVMVTDSDSTVRLLSARDGKKVLDTSVSLVGGTAVLNKGIGAFEVVVKPTFDSVDEDRATLLRQPLLYVEGTDAEANANMQSDVHQVFLAENRSVCPPGYVLNLDDAGIRAGPGACGECPQTTFSSHPLESRDGSCRMCPPGMVCGGGKDVKPLEEFWANPELVHGNTSVDMYDPDVAGASDRRSIGAVQIKAVRCAEGACLDNWACREGHRGRLCGVCKDRSPNGNPYAMGANGCVECKESNKAVAWIIAILCITLALILYYLAVWRPLIKFDAIESAAMSCWKRVGDTAKSTRASVLKCVTRSRDNASMDMRTWGTMTAYLKVVVGFFQVTSSFLSNLEVDFPASLKVIMSVFSLFNLDFFSLPNTECLLSQMNHTTKVVLCTLFLIAVLLLLALPLACICSSGADDTKKRNVVSAFYFSSMAFLFVFYPFVSKVIIETFICVDLGKNSVWLKSDLRERCPTSNSLGFVWSVIFTIAIPIGVPGLFLGLLFRFQIPWLAQYKMKMHRLQAVLEKMALWQSTSPQFAGWQGTAEPVNLLSREQCTSVLAHDFVRDPTAAEFEGAIDALEDQLAGRISSTGAGVAGDAQVVVAEDESLDALRQRTAEYVDKLTSSQIVSVPPVSWDGETGDVEQDAIEKCGFLFLTYKADCWWFEIFEMSRKVILSAVISFVSDPDVRLAVAYLISFGSLVVVVLARPFLNPSVNFFMTAALITQTLTLVYGLMLMVKKYAETQAVPKSEMNFFQDIIVLLNAVLFAIPLIEMFLRDVILLLGGMMLKPVYSGEQQMATIDDPAPIDDPARTLTSKPRTVMFLRDDLVYTEMNVLGTSAMPSERESLLEQENLALQQEIAKYQQGLG